MATKAATTTTIDIDPIKTGRITVHVKGTRPLIIHRVSQKAQRTLLMPEPKGENKKAGNLKHHPLEEFAASPYTLTRTAQGTPPTFLALPAVSFKHTMGTAALDLPGAKKSQIGRLVWVEAEMVGVYGEPQVFMSIVRSADINRTPDMRTRCILPQWCAELSLSFLESAITEKAILNLLAAGGLLAGVGDWRQQKGSSNFGQFVVTSDDDPEVVMLKQQWGRDAQVAAMKDPVAYDDETTELLEWFNAEVNRRGVKVVA